MSNTNLNTLKVTDPGNAGAIPVTAVNMVCNMVSAGAGETRTLADPKFVGQTCTLTHDTDGGGITVTAASVINKAGNNTMEFAHLRDSALLVAVTAGGALRWQLFGDDDLTLG